MNVLTLFLGITILVVPSVTHAYLGMGPLLPMIGSGIMLLFVFGMSLLGFIVYPLTALRKKLRKKNTPTHDHADDSPSS